MKSKNEIKESAMREAVLTFIDRFRKALEEDFESIKQKKMGMFTSYQEIESFA